ncbi:MAG: helix-turn-helix transcriptional regulator [Clostridia bacterium]|nr:helix-turn-helix transcriptional regulator [Clostridia bacterium]
MRTKNEIAENGCEYSYDKLWKLLIDRKLRKKDLQKLTHISPAVIAKMGRGEAVNLSTLGKICVVLECGLSDVVDIVKKVKPKKRRGKTAIV